MSVSKFFKSLQFRLIGLVVLIVLASNVGIINVTLNLSKKSTAKTVNELLNATTDSASGKIKDENEKHFRMLEAVANMDFLKDSSTPLLQKCQQLTRIAKISDDYENIGYYDLQGNSYTADGRRFQLQRAYIDNAKKGEKTITNPAINPITHILFQIYAVPVYGNDGKPIGCITANVLGDNLSKKIEQIKFGTTNSHIQVIDIKTGHIIASGAIDEVIESNDIKETSSTEFKPVLNKIMSGETGNIDFYDPTAKMKMIEASKVGSGAFILLFDPNVTGLQKDIHRTFSFVVTELGYMFPAANDSCLWDIYGNDFVTKFKN